MRSIFATSVSLGIMLSIIGAAPSAARGSSASQPAASLIRLPDPIVSGNLSVESAMHRRRSARNFARQPLRLAEASQLLWAAQGVTAPDGKRTAPSAGALYPLELYLVAGEISGLDKGVYQYQPLEHALRRVADGDRRTALAATAFGQDWISEGAAVIVVAADYKRTTGKYGQRGIRYTHLEAGHAAQNISLQAVALNLGTVVVGAFDDDKVKKIVNMPGDEQPLSILPIGRIRQAAQ